MTQSGRPFTRGWEVVDGVIHLKNIQPRAGAIVTKEEFGDFRLRFEWKVPKRGNSGIKYRVADFSGRMLGCEYQVCDDWRFRNRSPRNRAGALYDLYEPSKAKQLQPVGQFNTACIEVRGDSIKHWLNGQLIVSAVVGSPEWERRHAESKFNDVPEFGRNRRGRLMLTDHSSEVWYRNFEFELFPDEEKTGAADAPSP